MKQIDKNAILDWEKYKEDIYRATPVDQNMSQADIEKHRIYLEAHPIEWIKFFFPGYAKYEFADFQMLTLTYSRETRCNVVRSCFDNSTS